MYFKTCEYCECNLDPGEFCDCQKEEEPTTKRVRRRQYKYITQKYDMSKFYFKIKLNGEVLVL